MHGLAYAGLAAAARAGASMAEDLERLGAVPWVRVLFASLFLLGLAGGIAVTVGFLVRRPKPYALRERPWTGGETLALVALLAGLYGLLLTAAGWVNGRHAGWLQTGEGMAAAAVAQSFVFHWPILVFAGARMARRRLTPHEAFGLGPPRLGARFALGAALYPVVLPPVVFAAWVSSVVLDRFGIVPETQDILRLMVDSGAGPLRVYLAVFGVLIAPLAEEVGFRGIALPALARHIGFPAAALVISIVFAALHLNAAAFLPLVALSLAFSLAYLYSGSLAVPIAMHALFNGVTIAVQYAAGP